MHPLISIIIPSFNNGDKLICLLASIIEQTYDNYEIIIIDGGSSDNTLDVISKNRAKISYFVSENDDGIFDAMNKGIRASSGEWVFFIGCDDLFYNKFILENIFANKNLTETDVLYGKIYNQTKGMYEGEEINSKMELLSKPFWHQAIFYKKTIFNSTGLYEIKYKISADTVFNLKTYCKYDYNWMFIDNTVTTFSGDGISSFAFDSEYHKDQKRLYFDLFKELPIGKIYNGLQHNLYMEIKFGKLLTVFKMYFEICWHTKTIAPYTRNVGYYLKQRIFKTH